MGQTESTSRYHNPPERVCLRTLDTDLKTSGVHQRISLQVTDCHVGVRVETEKTQAAHGNCHVGVRWKPKKPKQYAAHNITWSAVDRSRECWITLK